MGTTRNPDLHGVGRVVNATISTAYPPCKAVLVDQDGELTCLDMDGQSAVVPLAGKVWHPLRITQFTAVSGITATKVFFGYDPITDPDA